MPRTKKKEYSEIDDIRHDLDSLKSNVVALTQHIKQDGRKQAKIAKSALSEKIAELQDNSHKQYEKMEKNIKANPGKSVAYAFMAGVVASYLFGRR